MFEKRDRPRRSWRWIIALTACFVVGLLVYVFTSGYVTRNSPGAMPPVTNQSAQAPQAPQQIAQSVSTAQLPQPKAASEILSGTPVAQAVASNALPGVVGITVERVQPGQALNKSQEEVGVGSGVIVSANGYILTNNHVAGGTTKRIVVSLADGRNVDGITLWADPVIDLAVVKVDLTGLPTLTLGDSTRLNVGEPAIAIGNPLGLEFQRTVTQGIVSALNRTIQIDTDKGANYMEDLIQTDASINPGNSGGPLLNSKSEVVGINTIKVTSAEAMGFAIPINLARPIISSFLNKGTFTEAYMGVFTYDKSMIPIVDGSLNVNQGVYVAHIDNNGPAYKAGLRLGCIIGQIDGKPINTMLDLRSYIYNKSPGDTINVTHMMKGTGKWVTVPVKLAARTDSGSVTR